MPRKSQTGKDAEPAQAAELAWVDVGGGYALALEDSQLVCRNAKGSRLKSVPKELREGEAAQQLLALKEWLERHARECVETVETWMLRSLPIPRDVVASVWSDPAWQRPLRDAVVMPLDGEGHGFTSGLLRGVDPTRGIGAVTPDGETRWSAAKLLLIPHQIVIRELDDFREFAGELQVEQGIAQLYRETFAKSADPAGNSVSTFAGGRFAQLRHALGRCRTLGFKVSGGFALTRVWEGGRMIEPRFWVGSDAPEAEAETGDLIWVDAASRQLVLSEVGAVAYSEGVRMASLIYAARVVEEKDDQG